jgi:predicted Zn-dependent protease
LESFSTEPKWYADLVLYHLREDAQARAVEAGQKWVKIEPKNVDAWIMLARACLEAGQEEAFHDAAAEAVRVGGEAARQRLVNEPGFERAKFDPRFEALVRPYADVF